MLKIETMTSKGIRLSSLILFGIGLVGITSANAFAETKSNDSVDDYISGLNYDNKEILTRNGESIENVPPTEGQLKDGKFVVLKREKKQLSNGTADISVINSNGTKAYVGALLKADSNLVDNNPTVLSTKRAPLTLSVDLPGMTNGDSHAVVTNPTNSSVRSSINNILDKWNNKYAQDYPNVAAQLQYSETMAYSMEQLKAKFGVSVEKLAVPLNIDFSSVSSGEKQVAMVNFKQIYYTVSMDSPENAGDVFDKSVTVDKLKKKGVTDQTPPTYVSSVAYGRSMYVKLETNSKSKDVQNAFSAAIKGVDISQNTEYQSILNDTSFTAIILGGDAGEASKVVSGKIEDLKKVIEEGSRYGKLNPAVPISYSTSFLKDNSSATIQNHTDYIKTDINSYNDGVLNLDHSGAYVLRYNITWDELSYDKDGNEVLTPKEWDKNGQGLTAHFGTNVSLKGNVRNLKVKAEECTGLAWEWWRTIYEKSDLPLVKERTISNWGTTLSPKVSDDVSD